MDNLVTLIEPQLAIPVVAVVVFAVLVYIFGFQKTQEPSFQHLAVLQSSGKSKSANGVTKQNKQPAPSPRTQTKGKEKPISNGNVVQGSASLKENVKPTQQPATPKAKKEKNVANVKPDADFEDGDWIQAPSRKDKKTRGKKEDVKNDEKVKKAPPSPAGKPRTILQEIELRAKLEQEQEPKKEIVTKKTVKEEKTVVLEKIEADSLILPKKEEAKKIEEPSENKKPSSAATADPKNNIAFDEVGDLWEEAKSRGAKKKRARKD